MALISEEEGEIVEDCVTDYHFVDCSGEPISFSALPLQLNDNEKKYGIKGDIYLRGKVDGGLRTIYKKVIAWKIELSCVLPEIYVLSDTGYKRWIKLQRPRKIYESVVRTVLISVHCLHFMKRNSEGSEEVIQKHIRKTLSTLKMSQANSLVDHILWITEAALWDKDIKKSKNLPIFLYEMSVKRKASYEENHEGKKMKFINNEDDRNGVDDGGNEESNDTLFDRVCAFCDDGGDILCCEGRCMRSFHPTIESGAGSLCESLGYTNDQVEGIPTFLCMNCQYQRHQCFICGKLGSSNKSSSVEVFPCVAATCGHFYHPQCVSQLVFPRDNQQAQELQKQIEAGKSFTCPAHKCCVCEKTECNDHDMRFALCRRCPKAYHRKCLPRNISFKGNDPMRIPQRAWEGLLTKRILIYCMDHKINRKILTPQRNHLLFPDVIGNKENSSELLLEKGNVVLERRSKAYGILTVTEEVEEKKLSSGTTGNLRWGNSIKQSEENLLGKVSKSYLSSRMTFPKCVAIKNPTTMESSKLPRKKDPSVSMLSMKRVPVKDKVQAIPDGSAKTLRDAEMEKRIQRLIKDSTSSFNMEDFLKEQRSKCTHANLSHFRLDKTITLGKVECTVKAIQAALEKVENGSTIDDAKAVCEPDVLAQTIKWKKKLKVYLAPFLHGMKYTSFGRHFTKRGKLKEVVDRLRWYVQDGDTIVDFCCGSNDFSCMMKAELDRMGKNCFFKNYDLIQSKNDFNFERRDWMSVGVEELPKGSELILGLNPPFGVQAFHANQFIDKALTFKPKLLILIVPKETESLDRKKTRYDLIWKDDQMLSGKSFYLPGSVDGYDQQVEQWNLDPPPLYLWSRPDWTSNHKAVAIEHGHVIMNQDTGNFGGLRLKSNDAMSDYLMEENQDCYGDFSDVVRGYGNINSILDDLPEGSDGI